MTDNNTRDKYNLYNKCDNGYTYTTEYSNDESFIWVECNMCRADMIDTNDIRVEVDSDNYFCKSCSEKYALDVVRCMEY